MISTGIQVGGQATDHLELLVVLLPEHGDVGTALDEKLGDDRGDAHEMMRAGLAVQGSLTPATVTRVEEPARYISSTPGA